MSSTEYEASYHGVIRRYDGFFIGLNVANLPSDLTIRFNNQHLLEAVIVHRALTILSTTVKSSDCERLASFESRTCDRKKSDDSILVGFKTFATNSVFRAVFCTFRDTKLLVCSLMHATDWRKSLSSDKATLYTRSWNGLLMRLSVLDLVRDLLAEADRASHQCVRRLPQSCQNPTHKKCTFFLHSFAIFCWSLCTLVQTKKQNRRILRIALVENR